MGSAARKKREHREKPATEQLAPVQNIVMPLDRDTIDALVASRVVVDESTTEPTTASC